MPSRGAAGTRRGMGRGGVGNTRGRGRGISMPSQGAPAMRGGRANTT